MSLMTSVACFCAVWPLIGFLMHPLVNLTSGELKPRGVFVDEHGNNINALVEAYSGAEWPPVIWDPMGAHETFLQRRRRDKGSGEDGLPRGNGAAADAIPLSSLVEGIMPDAVQQRLHSHTFLELLVQSQHRYDETPANTTDTTTTTTARTAAI